MAVFDAAPLVATLLGEPGALAVRSILADPSRDAVSTINAAEVVDAVSRKARARHAEVLDTFELWVSDGLTVESLDWMTSMRAAQLRSEHYHRVDCPVSLADCCAVALAEQLGTDLVTSDSPQASVARAVGVGVHAVPDPSGRLPA